MSFNTMQSIERVFNNKIKQKFYNCKDFLNLMGFFFKKFAIKFLFWIWPHLGNY